MLDTRGKGNVMKLTKKELNKLVSFIDKEFSYDRRKIKREDKTSLFDFFALNYDTNTIVSIDNDVRLYVSIKRNNKIIEQKFIKNFNELNTFKKMIKCLG